VANRKLTQAGFTLLEVLMAIAIFALVATAAFSMLQQTLKSGEHFDLKASQLAELQRTHRLLQQDIKQVIARPVRDQFGELLPAVMSEEMGEGLAVELLEPVGPTQ